MSLAQGGFKWLGGWFSSGTRDRLPVRLGGSRATGMSSLVSRRCSGIFWMGWLSSSIASIAAAFFSRTCARVRSESRSSAIFFSSATCLSAICLTSVS